MKSFLSANLIGVHNVEEASKWYADIFGMELVELKPPYFCEMKLGEHHFLIEKHSPEREPGFQEIPTGVRVSAIIGVENMQSFVKEAKEKGVTIVQEPVQQPWGWNAIIADPYGNEFILDQEGE